MHLSWDIWTVILKFVKDKQQIIMTRVCKTLREIIYAKVPNHSPDLYWLIFNYKQHYLVASKYLFNQPMHNTRICNIFGHAYDIKKYVKLLINRLENNNNITNEMQNGVIYLKNCMLGKIDNDFLKAIPLYQKDILLKLGLYISVVFEHYVSEEVFKTYTIDYYTYKSVFRLACKRKTSEEFLKMLFKNNNINYNGGPLIKIRKNSIIINTGFQMACRKNNLKIVELLMETYYHEINIVNALKVCKDRKYHELENYLLIKSALFENLDD